ncbi:hypothetical protein ACB092_03G027700 [Castanea dentata]
MTKAVEGLYMEKYVLEFHALNQDVVVLLLLEVEYKSRSFAISISHYHGVYETSRMCQILLQGRQGLLADQLS